MKTPIFKIAALSLLMVVLSCLSAKAQTTVVSLAPTASPSGIYTLEVVYSTGMDPATSTNVANYSVTNVVGGNVPISSATLAADTVTVTLTLGAPLQVGTNSLTISNVQSTNSVVITPNPTTIHFGFLANVTATFNFDDPSYWGYGPSTLTGTNNFGETILTSLTGTFDDAVIAGGLNPGGGMLQLTGNSLGEQGEWVVPDLAGGAGVSNLNVSFYMVLDNPDNDPNNSTTNESDGMTFSWAPDATSFVLGNNLYPENGGGTGLIIEFHDYDKTWAPGGLPAGVFVKWGGSQSNYIVLYSTNQPWLNGPAIDGFTNAQLVSFSVAQNGTFNLTYGTNVIFANAVIPGYKPVAGGLMVFMATCAGFSDDCWIDDVTINENPMKGPAAVEGGPTDTTVHEGYRVTFSAIPVGATPYTYQWYSNGVAIVGATASAYTTPQTILAMSGTQYSVSVTNFLGGALSTNAMLTVAHALPQLFSVSGINNSSTVTVVYDQAMTASAANAANYSLVDVAGNPVSISSAILAGDNVTVTLNLGAPLQVEDNYILTVSNVVDSYGDTISPNPTTAHFMFMTGAFRTAFEFDNNTTTGTNNSGGAVATTLAGTTPPSVIPGGFEPAGGLLQLENDTLNISGYWTIPDQAGGAAVNDLDVSFKLAIGDPNNNNSGSEADGMSFSWAPDAAAGGGYLGSGTGLTVQFHTYNDYWKETAFGIFGQLPGIYVAFGGVGANQYYVLSSTDQPWLNVKPDQYIDGVLDVHFSVSANGTFNMTYGGQVIFSNAVITGYAPITGGKMIFSASSGGLTENCWLDHVAISESPSTAPPSAPTGLTATPSLGQVTLGWSTSVGAIDYNVYRSTTSGGPYTLIASGLTSPNYTDTGLNNGTTYYYVVKARSTYGGFSAYSTEVSATPTASAPPIAFVGSAEAAAANGAPNVSVTMTNQAGDTLVVAVRMGNQGPAYFLPSNVSDTAGNTYILVSGSGNNGGSNDRGSAMYMASNIVASAANTITFNTNGIPGYWGPPNGLAIVVEEFANVASVETTRAVGTGYTATGTLSSGSLTTTNVGDLLVFESDSQGGGSTWTAGSGYTIPANGQNNYLAMEYYVSSSPGTYSTSVNYDTASGSMDGVYVALIPKTAVITLPPALVASAEGVGTNNAPNVSVTMANNAGDTLVVAVRMGNQGPAYFLPSNVSDTAGNTYTLISPSGNNGGSNDRGSAMYGAANIVASAANTITFNTNGIAGYWGPPNGLAIVVEEFTNVAFLEADNNYGSGYSQKSSITSNPLTTTNVDDLLVFESDSQGGGSTWTAGSGYTIPANGQNNYLAMEYQVAGAPGTYSASVTYDVGTGSMDGVYAAFAPKTEVVRVVPPPPLAPTGLTATPGLGQVTLGWSASVGAIDYNVYRSTTSGGPYTQIASGVTATSYTDTGLNSGTTYYYVVKARSTYGGFSAYSTEVSATPTASAPPIAFVGSAEAAAANGAPNVSVTMTNQAGDTLVVAVRMGNQGPAYFLPSNVSDTAGNTYILVSGSGNNGGSNDRGSAMYMASNIVASAANTITFNTNGIPGYWGPPNGLAIVVEEFANVASVETTRAVGTGYTATGTLSSGSLTTTNVDDLLVFESDSQGGGSTWTAGSGYTIPANGQNNYLAMEYYVSSSPGTYSTSVNYDTASGSMDGVYVALIPKTAVITLSASAEAVATNGAPNVSVTMANNAGDTLVVAVRMGNQGPAYFLPSNVSDTAGNTYTLISPSGNNGGSNDRGSAMYGAANIVASAANTITFNTNGIAGYWGPPNGLAIVVEEFNNVAFLEADNNYGSGYSQKSSITSYPLTTTNAADLLVFESDSQGGGSTWTAGSGYTIPANGQNNYLAMEYQVAGAPAGTYSASVTYNVGTGSMDGVYAAFAPKTRVGVVIPPPSPISFTHSGNQLSLTWSGGKGILMSSTNLALPVASWTAVVTNPPMPYVITIPPGASQMFYRTK